MSLTHLFYDPRRGKSKHSLNADKRRVLRLILASGAIFQRVEKQVADGAVATLPGAFTDFGE
jgi:hypothetical protein